MNLPLWSVLDRPLRAALLRRRLNATSGPASLPSLSPAGAFLLAAAFLVGLGTLPLRAGPQVELTAPMLTPREGHTATVLPDGRVLIVGGTDGNGALASSEIYDPATKSFVPAGSLRTPRIGHAATLLADGRVLVSGGTSNGVTLATAEIYVPAADVFEAVAAPMAAGRSGHTANLLANGQVLLAGGDSAGTAESFDPTSQTFSPIGQMAARRAGHAASTLGERFIFFTGGGTNSVEVYDAVENTFSAWPKLLNEVRTGHVATSNADDTLLLVGGEPLGSLEQLDLESNAANSSVALGAASAAAQRLANDRVLVLGSNLAALFNPADSNVAAIDDADALKRSGQTTSELPANKHVLVAGGKDAANTLVAEAALYSPARIETDKEDYYPEEPVIVTGTGWKAGEEVDLYVVDSIGWVYDSTIAANAEGEFVADPYFVVLWQHLGVEFNLTAIGAESGLVATHVFTDSFRVGSVTVGPQSGTLTAGTASVAPHATFLITAHRASGSGTSGQFDAGFAVTSGLPVGVVAAFSPELVQMPNNTSSVNSTLTFQTSDVTPAGSYEFSVRVYNKQNVNTTYVNANDYADATGMLVIGQPASVVTWNDPAAIVYGTALGAAQLNATANVPGSFSYTPAAGTILDAGTQTLSTTFTPTAGGSPITKTVSLTVTPAAATIVVNGYTGTYDGQAHGATGSATGVLGEDLNTLLNLGESFTDFPGGTANWTFTGNNNYEAASGSVAITITKADATINVQGYTGTYDGQAHGATGTATGVLGENLNALLNLGAPFIDVPGGTANWSFAGNNNYEAASGSVAITISQATATVNVQGYTGTYDGQAHGATGSATGVLGENLTALLDLGDSFIDFPGGTANWSFAGNTNYAAANGAVSITINKAEALVTVSGVTLTYDGEEHGATGTATGVGGVDLSANLNLGAKFTNAPGGTANWSFTGGTNYNDQSGSVAIVINKADAVINVQGYTGIYDGQPHGATGTAKGVKGEDLEGLDLGASFVNAPGGTANWAFTDVTGNYNNASGSVAIVINKADAVVTVSGVTVTYDGEEHGATGSATGVGGVNLSANLNLGAKFINVPGGTAHWTFDGGTNYNDQSGSVPIVINKADATINVQGYTGTYDGQAHGATGTATGVQNEVLAGLDLGEQFTDAPGGTANWTFTDVTGNYNNASGSVEIVINKADALVTVSGVTVTYDGEEHGATGTATGVGGVNLSANLNLGAKFINVPGGTAQWTFTGGTNYNDQSGSVEIVINKADATIVVNSYSVIYDGNAHTSTGTATGAAGEDLSELLDLSGTTHTNAGSYTGDVWTFAGDNNHHSANGTVDNVISPKSITITANDRTKSFGETVTFTGTEFTVVGLVGTDTIVSVTLTSDGAPASALASGSPYAIVPSSAVFGSGLASNYSIEYANGELTVNPLTFVGFLPPIGGSVTNGNGGSYADPVRAYKLNSTIPVKFTLTNNGAPWLTGIHTLQAAKFSNATTSEQAIDVTPTDAATAGNQFRLTGGEWHFNLSTKGLSAGTWKLIATLADGTQHEVWIAIKK